MEQTHLTPRHPATFRIRNRAENWSVVVFHKSVTRSHIRDCEITVTAKIFHPLLALIASATESELAKYVEYLKEENRILRARLSSQVHTKPSERERLLQFGKVLGRAIEELITIVSPSSFYRWVRDEKDDKNSTKPKGGRRKPEEIRELVIQIAKTTGFGYTRILGELRKLGIKKISRQTVRRILKEEGIEPGPDRTSDSWQNFIERHKETLWGCDFFSVRAVTAHGIKQMYVLAFLCLETREVILSESTEHPNSAWVSEDELPRLLAATTLRPLAESGRETVKLEPKDGKRSSWTYSPLTLANIDAAIERARKKLANKPEVIEAKLKLGRERGLAGNDWPASWRTRCTANPESLSRRTPTVHQARPKV